MTRPSSDDGELEDHVRPPLGHPCPPGLVLAPRLGQVEKLDVDARRPQVLCPARRLGVRVGAAGDHPRDTRLEDPVDARRRAPVVGARLHGHEDRPAPGRLAGGVERDRLRVRPSGRLADPLADDRAVRSDDDGADRRVRVPAAGVRGRELERALEAHAAAAASRAYASAGSSAENTELPADEQ